MPHLIDGHNLIASLPDIGMDDPNKEAKLVNKLKSWAAANGRAMKSRSRMTGRMVGSLACDGQHGHCAAGWADFEVASGSGD